MTLVTFPKVLLFEKIKPLLPSHKNYLTDCHLVELRLGGKKFFCVAHLLPLKEAHLLLLNVALINTIQALLFSYHSA